MLVSAWVVMNHALLMILSTSCVLCTGTYMPLNMFLICIIIALSCLLCGIHAVCMIDNNGETGPA